MLSNGIYEFMKPQLCRIILVSKNLLSTKKVDHVHGYLLFTLNATEMSELVEFNLQWTHHKTSVTSQPGLVMD